MSSERRWIPVARAGEVAADKPLGAAAEGREVVLVESTAGLRAYGGRCPHQGTLLAEGEIQGHELVCRAHGWRFDCATGERTGAAQRPGLQMLPCRVENGAIEVSVEADSTARSKATRRIEDLPGPRGLPFVGSLFSLRPDRVHAQFEAWAREYGPFYRLKLGRHTLLIVADAKTNESMLRARPGTYRRIGSIEPTLGELGATGVFSVEGETWRRQRRLAMEALANRHLRTFYPTLARVAERLHKRWIDAAREGRRVAIAEDLMRFTVDVTTSLTFGIDMNTLEQEEIIQRHLAQLFPAANRRLFAPFPYWRYVKLPADRRVDRALVEIRRVVEPMIADARAKLSASPPEAASGERSAHNFLEAMLLARDEDGRPFSDETIFGNALTMLLAGEDTTAHTLGWITHELLERPQVLAKLVEEIDRELGTSTTPRDLETANRLPYVDAVVSETMRLRPVAPFVGLESNEDTVAGDLAVPRGTRIFLLLRAPAVDETNFTDAREFRPERWLEPAPPVHAAHASVPFGSGPRICPGRSLALLEMRVVIATMLRSFHLERAGERDSVREELSFAMIPKNLAVRLRERSAQGAIPASTRSS